MGLFKRINLALSRRIHWRLPNALTEPLFPDYERLILQYVSKLDAGTVLLGSLALGMAVDDTMHIISGVHARGQQGQDDRTALDETLSQTLPALVYTTAVVAAGFGVLGHLTETLR